MPVTELADAFAAYEARQIDQAVRWGDLEDDALNDCDTAKWLLDSLNQHPDEHLPDTVRRPDLAATDIRAALVAHWTPA